MSDYQKSGLWKTAFLEKSDEFQEQKELLTTVFKGFRGRVSLLVSQINKDLPDLTVHDITHIDQLWWTASEITGEDYKINPAEAFVLGGAFLLHDSAHCIAAYPGGISEIKKLQLWRDISFMVMRDGEEPKKGTEEYQRILFDVLRIMHPKHARKLATLKWGIDGEDGIYLIENAELREAYGDAIGLVAESHWWNPHELESLKDKYITSPVCLSPAGWVVDVFKLAIIMRTADAAHIDARRAPRFLRALVKPGGGSLLHWTYQSKLNQVKLDEDLSRNELRVTGSPFSKNEVEAWWMAYDAARLINSELNAADRLLLEHNRQRFSARTVGLIYSPEAFSKGIPVQGWYPIDASVKISDIKLIVERFGGAKLYGADPKKSIRELLQNGIDAVHACRSLGGLGDIEGEIEISVENDGEGYWVHVTDTGVGMSRYVLTDILLDFGRSLWRSADINGEWERLSSSGFTAVGEFGIGFYAVFMLGERVKVTTNRFVAKKTESVQWILEFHQGVSARPVLREPGEDEKLLRHGTRVSVYVTEKVFVSLLPKIEEDSDNQYQVAFEGVCASIAPAIDVNLYVNFNGERRRVVEANDWKTMEGESLFKRLFPRLKFNGFNDLAGKSKRLTDLYNDCGVLRGRCVAAGARFFSSDLGVGVVDGLYAGEVDGVAGIVFVKRQSDLARTSAIPDVSLENLQKWANEQRTWFVERMDSDRPTESMLVRYGAQYSGLFMGYLGGSPVNYEEFIDAVRYMDELHVHDGEVSHDSNDDVLEKDFDEFEADILLFEKQDARIPAWMKEIDGYDVAAENWNSNAMFESAMKEAWGDFEWNKEDVVVGGVQFTDVVRECVIARKS